MAATEMKTLTCPGPPEHEFQIPKGRGRPPRYCDEHKPNGKSEGGQKVGDEETRTRPRPGPKQENGGEPARPRPRAPRITPQEKGPLDEPTPQLDGDDTPTTDPGLRRIPPPRGDKGARGKSESAAERAAAVSEVDAVPRGVKGRPLAKIEFSTSELIPTGNYANVTVGPIRITAYVDLDRDSDDGYFSETERDTLVRASNELAEMGMRDVIGVQRNLVIESLQADDAK